jgi:uncharacterized protein (TIGR02757 family)
VISGLKNKLDCLYGRYNDPQYIDPDPLVFVCHYADQPNREIAGFIAACFAYGRVEMIMKTVDGILNRLGPDPAGFLAGCSRKDLEQMFDGFRYRFATHVHLVNLLMGLKRVMARFSSLEACFYQGMDREGETVLSGLRFLSDQIRDNCDIGHLLADPHKASACKRSHLFLRWMIRKDRVDPGCWQSVCAGKLIIPLDRHMFTAGTMLGFTKRKSADLKTALEITRGFRQLEPQDPVKYDFCLTRFGIRRELTMDTLRNFVC